MPGAETARRRVVQRRIGGADMTLPQSLELCYDTLVSVRVSLELVSTC